MACFHSISSLQRGKNFQYGERKIIEKCFHSISSLQRGKLLSRMCLGHSKGVSILLVPYKEESSPDCHLTNLTPGVSILLVPYKEESSSLSFKKLVARFVSILLVPYKEESRRTRTGGAAHSCFHSISSLQRGKALCDCRILANRPFLVSILLVPYKEERLPSRRLAITLFYSRFSWDRKKRSNY